MKKCRICGELHDFDKECECTRCEPLPVRSESAGSVSETLRLIEKADQLICDLCTGKKRWTMSVPVDEENDTDCVLSKALVEAKKLIEKQNV